MCFVIVEANIKQKPIATKFYTKKVINTHLLINYFAFHIYIRIFAFCLKQIYILIYNQMENTGDSAENNAINNIVDQINFGSEEDFNDTSNRNTAEIDINVKERPAATKQTVNFKTTDFLKDFVSQPTQETPKEDEFNPSQPRETVEDIRRRMLQEEEDAKNSFTLEDFEMIAEFLIDLIDMGAIFLIRMWSLDTTDAPYKIPAEKTNKLKKQLARLLIKMQVKMPLGFLFILTLIMAYLTPARKAFTNRKEVLKRRKREAEIEEAQHQAELYNITNKPFEAKPIYSEVKTSDIKKEYQEVKQQIKQDIFVQDTDTNNITRADEILTNNSQSENQLPGIKLDRPTKSKRSFTPPKRGKGNPGK